MVPVTTPTKLTLLAAVIMLSLITTSTSRAVVAPDGSKVPALRWVGAATTDPADAQQTIMGDLHAITKRELNAPLRVMTYNIRHGAGMDGVVDLPRLVAVIRQMDPDIIFFTEVDNHWRRSGFVDETAYLAQALQMPFAISADTLTRQDPYQAGFGGIARYGNALLSRFPITWAKTTPLPSGLWQEPRVALTADVQIKEETAIRILGTHLGLDHADRMAQVETLLDLARGWTGPRLLLGDFNCLPYAKEVRRLTGQLDDELNSDQPLNDQVIHLEDPIWVDPAGPLGPPTFPADLPTKRIDYILVSPELAPSVLRYESPMSQASDHLPVLVEIRL